MRQDFFEFRPTFKLVIAGNHKPSLRCVDEAIRRRFHLVPFSVTIPSEDRDSELAAKLKAEWSGILSWVIDGCVQWQTEGLRPPQAVTDATTAYLEAEDAVAAWIDDRCTRDPNAWEQSSRLFASWRAWADRAEETPGTMRRFAQTLENRGFQPLRKMHGRGFLGLQIAPDAESEPYWKREL
jgi:putative DNA primase/helicase